MYVYLFILRIKVSWQMDYYELSSYNNNLITIKLEINNFMWSNWDGVFGYCFIILLKLRLDNLLAKTINLIRTVNLLMKNVYVVNGFIVGTLIAYVATKIIIKSLFNIKKMPHHI